MDHMSSISWCNYVIRLFEASSSRKLGSCSIRRRFDSLLLDKFIFSSMVSCVISTGNSDMPMPLRSSAFSLPRLACLIFSLISYIIWLVHLFVCLFE